MHFSLYILIVIVLPLIQYSLLQLPKYQSLAGPIVIALALAIPILDKSQGIYAGLFVAIILRSADVACLDLTTQTRFTFTQFFEYYMTYQVHGYEKIDRRLAPYPTLTKNTIPYEKLTPYFLCKRITVILFKFKLYWLILGYVERNRLDWNPQTMKMNNFTSWRDVVDSYLLGQAVCLMIDVATSGMVVFSLIMKWPYVSIMNSPYIATSAKDFWGNRWNVAVQNSLRRIVFDPVMHKLFKHPFPLPRGKVPAWHTMVAGFITFLASGLLHEWIILVVLEKPTRYEQLTFFCLQGVIITLETVIQRLTRKHCGIDLKHTIPYPVQVAYVILLTIWASPLFLNPFTREKLYFRFLTL